jgi:hypothetical protein
MANDRNLDRDTDLSGDYARDTHQGGFGDQYAREKHEEGPGDADDLDATEKMHVDDVKIGKASE